MSSRTEVARLDELIDELGAPSESQCELLREHLESARSNLLGGVVEGYVLNLKLADETLHCITDHDRKQRVTDAIRDLLAVAK
jgi:hypothetical protein